MYRGYINCRTIHFTVISVLQSSVKSIGKCKKKKIFADSNAQHFNFCPKTNKKYITDMCSCYTIAWLCKLQKRVHSTRSRK